MWISKLFIEFILISFIGWIWEVIYNLFHEKRWVSRGFLYGPICPIYGAATLIGIGIIYLFQTNGHSIVWWYIAISAFFGSAVLEYITAVVLEKLFHACWWDYSDLRFHYKGRICLSASLAFAGAALLIYYLFLPLCNSMFSLLSPATIEFIAMVLMAFLAMDITMTITVLTDFEKKVTAADDIFHGKMAEIVENLFKYTTDFYRKGIRRVKGFKYPSETQEHIKKALEKMDDEYKK